VISALDNLKAREHLAKNATKYGKVMIDAGTSGYNGQSYSSVRFKTSCHNCYSS
jgi:ubiquitin-like 1-activating enzyme E1 B